MRFLAASYDAYADRIRAAAARIPRVDVPLGACGAWSVRAVETLTPEEADRRNRRVWCDGSRAYWSAVTYRGLYYRGEGVMSDQPHEWLAHREAIVRATGRVLITGLGLGLVLDSIARKPDVRRVVVVEKNPEVVTLVWEHYRQRYGDRLTLVMADAFDYAPAERFDVAWHDPWNGAASPADFAWLRQRYAPYADWQGCWSEVAT